MSVTDEISWFIATFGARIEPAVAGTPLSTALLAGIAMQETGYLWPSLREATTTEADLLALCVGDTLDASGGRRAFPATKADLLAARDGDRMFAIACKALEGIAAVNSGYRRVAGNPDKFCHGFGIFQLDLQFFRDDPDYFLSESWTDFAACLGKAVKELARGLKVLGYDGRTALTTREAANLAIVYNSGGYDPARGLKQGYRDGNGKYYGEIVFDYIAIAETVAGSGKGPATAPHLPPAGSAFSVIARGGLILRGGPGTEFGRQTALPFGTRLRVLGYAGEGEGWAQVDLEGDGAADGYVFAQYLAPA